MTMTLSMALVSLCMHALGVDPYQGPKPVAVLVQTDPWAMVIGSDTPLVAIYDDGGGKKWAVSIRYVFPSEPVWRKAFDGIYEKP